MFLQDGGESFADFGVLGDFEERFHCDGDVLAIPLVVAVFYDVSEGSECLHEALGSAFVEKRSFWTLIGYFLPEIEELGSLVC